MRIIPKAQWHRIAQSLHRAAAPGPLFWMKRNPPDVYRRVAFVRLGGQSSAEHEKCCA